MQNELNVSIAPHIKSPRTTTGIMLDVIIALCPAAIAGIIIFGIGAFAVIAMSVIAAVAAEYLFCLITKRPNTVKDLSAAVTGLLLALNLPADTPVWQVAIGAVFAVIFVKCIFGGIGQNFANPAITARIFMLIAFTNVTVSAYPIWQKVDTISSATPLAQLTDKSLPNLLDLFIGNRGGAIGEVCIAALLIGAVYLIVKKVISPAAPLAFIGTVYAMSLIYEGGDFIMSLGWIMSGGLVLGAFFMATDYSTTPTTTVGKIVFGVGAGLITAMIRFFGTYPEGVSFAILLMNILTPYIDRFTQRKPFGGDAK